MIRVVLDANVVVSALIRPEGPPGAIVARVVAGTDLVAVVSPAILDEYRRCLGYPKVRRRLGVPVAETLAWVDALTLISEIVLGERELTVVEADPDDDKYVVAAVESNAAFIVSGDRDLLDLGHHQGVAIVTPRAFLDVLEKRAGR